MNNYIFIVFLSLNISIYPIEKKNINSKQEQTFNENNINQITTELSKGLIDNNEKLLAFYKWIIYNIEYDKQQEGTNRRIFTKDQTINEVLKRRKGICQHYADLFHKMCQLSNIESYKVLGYTKDRYGKLSIHNHIWNIIKLKNKYFFFDLTWAAGSIRELKKFNTKYYMKSATDFIKDHMPFDPTWQLLKHPITHKEFISGNRNRKHKMFNYLDTIKLIKRQTKIDYYSKIINRMDKSDFKLIIEQKKEYKNLLNQNIIISASIILNESIDIINQFINLKNKSPQNSNQNFLPLIQLIQESENKYSESKSVLKKFKSSHNKLSSAYHKLKEKLDKIKVNIDREKEYLYKLKRGVI
jgi:hypothetical protein